MLTDAIRQALTARGWAPTVPFSIRLGELRGLLQARFDRLPRSRDFAPRVPIALPLPLDDLALVLPPSERRLLDHLRARRPRRDLVRTRSFHSVSRLNHRLQRLASRIQVYCGSAARHRLMQPYDRPGHDHRRRPGRPRRMLSTDRFPQMRVWVSRRFAATHGLLRHGTEPGPTREDGRRAARRLLRSQRHPDRRTVR
jgi:hypothetical protein